MLPLVGIEPGPLWFRIQHSPFYINLAFVCKTETLGSLAFVCKTVTLGSLYSHALLIRSIDTDVNVT